MDKIKLNLQKQKNKTIKIDNYKIEVKPYLTSSDIMEISKICIQQFENDSDNFSLIKTIYDILVLDKCTNISVKGVSRKKHNKETQVFIELDNKILDEFDSSMIIQKISPLIYNYNDAYSNICKCIELKNIYNAFNMVSNSIPSAEQMNNALSVALQSMKSLKQDDPETFNQVVKQSIVSEVKKG